MYGYKCEECGCSLDPKEMPVCEECVEIREKRKEFIKNSEKELENWKEKNQL